MKRLVVVAGMALGLLAAPAGAVDGVHWSSSDLATLDRWVDAAPLDALPRPSTDALQAARDGTDRAMVDEAADALALRLARMQLLGAASAAQRSGWNIDDSDEALPLEVVLAAALATDTLDPCTLTDQSQCPRWTSPAPVDALLEVPAGALDGIEPGTHVTIREDQP